MLIDASAIVAVLMRLPGWENLLARLDAARPPHLTTPLALVEAIAALARAKARDGVATPALLGQARAAVGEFAAALGLREVPVTAELGRRAAEAMAAGERDVGKCFGEAASRAYRTDLLTAEAR